MKPIIKHINILIFACISSYGLGQGVDSLASRVIIENADLQQYDATGEEEIQWLKGNVRVYQDDAFMFCDSAIIQDQVFTAIGNVVIVQSDTITVYADSLVYNSQSKLARLYDNVTLDNSRQQLFTQYMTYHVGQRVATYQDTALMIDGTAVVQSIRGRYDVNLKSMSFYDQVVVRDSSFDLRSDSLKYNTELDRAIFISAADISTDSIDIYCESGFYDVKKGYGFLTDNAQYRKEDTRATGDTMIYDKENDELRLIGSAIYSDSLRYASADVINYFGLEEITELQGNASYRDTSLRASGITIKRNGELETIDIVGNGEIIDKSMQIMADSIYHDDTVGDGYAKGSVFWDDTTNRISICCDQAIFNTKREEVKAIGLYAKPLMEKIEESDTLFMTADTLVSIQVSYPVDSLTLDSANVLLAYKDVKIYKSNFQGICDSLSYETKDSTFKMFQAPIVWSDTTQFVGDTIVMFQKGKSVDKILVRSNAFITSQVMTETYDQIKGRNVDVFFVQDTLDNMMVTGNAESIYFPKDESGAFIGANKTICSWMHFFFENEDLRDIKFYTQPESTMTPIQDVDPFNMRLTGFKWNSNLKPKSVFDLYD